VKGNRENFLEDKKESAEGFTLKANVLHGDL
jgi:hypothetical protein